MNRKVTRDVTPKNTPKNEQKNEQQPILSHFRFTRVTTTTYCATFNVAQYAVVNM